MVSALVGTLIGMVVLISCETEIEDTLGDGVIGGDPFVSDSETFDVFAVNRRVTAVQTNKLPIYQLGVYNDPVFGRREARITSQLNLPGLAGNPTFGNLSQAQEDDANSDDEDNTVPEEEKITEVFLYIPYQLVPNGDRDGDGVDADLDLDDTDPNSDSDGDGISDIDETRAGTNPNDRDTDGDGIEDGDDDDTIGNIFPRSRELDSIFSNAIRATGNRDVVGTQFNLRVEESGFFLRDLDPNTNFVETQDYFSNTDITSFTRETLFDGSVTISDMETIILNEEDPDTEVLEANTVQTRLDPGIRIALDTAFFQRKILDMEGMPELSSQVSFSDFFRGVHLTLTPQNGEDLLLLLDLSRANITINYQFEDFVPGEEDGQAGTMETAEGSFQLNFLVNNAPAVNGNAVNTFIDDPFPSEIEDSLDNDTNVSRIFLKGGSGVYAEINLFEEDNGTTVINQIRENNWIINEANLVFYIDQETIGQNGTFEPPRLFLFNAETNQALPDFLTEVTTPQVGFTNPVLNFGGALEEDGDGRGLRYTVRITEYINDLIVRGEDNVTLGLTLTASDNNLNVILPTQEVQVALDENSDGTEVELPVASSLNPLGTVLFGSNVEPQNEGQRLRLEIFFTEAN